MQSSLIPLNRCCSLQTWTCLIWHFICLKYDSVFKYLLLNLFDGLFIGCKALYRGYKYSADQQTTFSSSQFQKCIASTPLPSCTLTQALSDQTEKMQTDVLHCCFSILIVESVMASKFKKTLLWLCCRTTAGFSWCYCITWGHLWCSASFLFPRCLWEHHSVNSKITTCQLKSVPRLRWRGCDSYHLSNIEGDSLLIYELLLWWKGNTVFDVCDSGKHSGDGYVTLGLREEKDEVTAVEPSIILYCFGLFSITGCLTSFLTVQTWLICKDVLGRCKMWTSA